MTNKLQKGATITTKENEYKSAFEKLKILITTDPIEYIINTSFE